MEPLQASCSHNWQLCRSWILLVTLPSIALHGSIVSVFAVWQVLTVTSRLLTDEHRLIDKFDRLWINERDIKHNKKKIIKTKIQDIPKMLRHPQTEIHTFFFENFHSFLNESLTKNTRHETRNRYVTVVLATSCRSSTNRFKQCISKKVCWIFIYLFIVCKFDIFYFYKKYLLYSTHFL